MTPQPIINGRHLNQDPSPLRGTILFCEFGQDDWFDVFCMAEKIGAKIITATMLHPGTSEPWPWPATSGIKAFESIEQLHQVLQTGREKFGLSFINHDYTNNTCLYGENICPGATWRNPGANFGDQLQAFEIGRLKSYLSDYESDASIHLDGDPRASIGYQHVAIENQGIHTWRHFFGLKYFAIGETIFQITDLDQVESWRITPTKLGVHQTRRGDYREGTPVYILPRASMGFMFKPGSDWFNRAVEARHNTMAILNADSQLIIGGYKDGNALINKPGEKYGEITEREMVEAVDPYYASQNGIRYWGGRVPNDPLCRRTVHRDAYPVEGMFKNEPDPVMAYIDWFDREWRRIDDPTAPYIREAGLLYMGKKLERRHVLEYFAPDRPWHGSPMQFQVLPSWWQKDEDERNGITSLIGKLNAKGN